MIAPQGTEGLALFAPSIAGSATSEAAAQAIDRGTSQRQRDRILAYLRTRSDGATASEVSDATGIPPDCCRPRLLELGHGVGQQRGLGLIVRLTTTRTVPGHRAANLWRVR